MPFKLIHLIDVKLPLKNAALLKVCRCLLGTMISYARSKNASEQRK